MKTYITTQDVKEIAQELHSDQKLRSGKPYFGHCVKVAEKAGEMYLKYCEKVSHLASDVRVPTYHRIRQAGYLHDTIEDCGIDIDYLLDRGVDPEVTIAVCLLSKPNGLFNYFEYLEKIKENQIARFVKLADLDHNSRPSRLGWVNQRRQIDHIIARQEKYLLSYMYLEGVGDLRYVEEKLRAIT